MVLACDGSSSSQDVCDPDMCHVRMQSITDSASDDVGSSEKSERNAKGGAGKPRCLCGWPRDQSFLHVMEIMQALLFSAHEESCR